MVRPPVLALLPVFTLLACGTTERGAPGDCTVPASCPSNVHCTAGVVRCGPGGAVQQCKPDGSGWADLAHCSANQSCRAGQCAPAGCMGTTTTQCTGDGRIQTCLPSVGGFSDPTPCTVGQVCLGTGCVPQVCSPNQRFCADSMTAAQCDALGGNSTVTAHCTGNSACAGGDCVDARALLRTLKVTSLCSL